MRLRRIDRFRDPRDRRERCALPRSRQRGNTQFDEADRSAAFGCGVVAATAVPLQHQREAFRVLLGFSPQRLDQGCAALKPTMFGVATIKTSSAVLTTARCLALMRLASSVVDRHRPPYSGYAEAKRCLRRDGSRLNAQKYVSRNTYFPDPRQHVLAVASSMLWRALRLSEPRWRSWYSP
jgi:hypothetical protein